MGREIRLVPPNWEHPKEKHYNFIKRISEERYMPKYDENYDEAVKEWNEGIVLWNTGKHPDQINHREEIEAGKVWEGNLECFNDPDYYSPEKGYNYWDNVGNPPTEEMYLPYTEDECSWFQVYETVSEGTPVTPPFPTKEELVNYLVENGDFWDQRRGDGGWNKESAERFVKNEWAPSMIVSNGEIKTPKEM